MPESEKKSPLWKKLAWFVMLWTGGVLFALLAGWVIKAFMPA